MGLRELFSEDVSGVLDMSDGLGKRCYCTSIANNHTAGEHVGVIHKPPPTNLDQGAASGALQMTQCVHTTSAADAGVAASSPQGTASVATQAASPLADTSVATEVYPDGGGNDSEPSRPTTPQPASPNPTPKKKSRMNELMAGL